jgi:hypothetical protein
MDIADRYGSLLRRRLRSADHLSGGAIAPGPFLTDANRRWIGERLGIGKPTPDARQTPL